jgi:predicted amidohydrolase
MPRIEPYFAAVCQTRKVAPTAYGWAKFDETVQANLDRMCGMIDYCCAGNMAGKGKYNIIGPVKLVCFGEYGITGSYSPARPSDHRLDADEVFKMIAIQIPGPLTARLAEKAAKYGVYVSCANIEFDPAWPDIHFNTAFILGPTGKVILKYHKILSNNPSEIACSDHDIMDKYRNPISGKFDPFPVVDTAIGRLAAVVCADLAAPETFRVYSLKGADLVMHLTSGNSHSMGGWRPVGIIEAVKRVRAYDSCLYLVNANWGPVTGGMFPEHGIAGHSAVIDFQGNEVAKSEDCGEQVIRGKVDIEARREHALRYYHNPVTQLRNELYAPWYGKTIYPANTFLKDGPIKATLDNQQVGYFETAMANLEKAQDFYSEHEVK